MRSFFSTKTIKQLPKRDILIVLVIVVFSGIFIFSVSQANAGIGKDFAASLGANALGIITTLFWALQWVALWFIDMAVAILNFSFNNLLDAAFYKTEFIRESWRSVRDLANMFFILWLVAIALATILNIKSWSAKKLLPRLLAIALLVNFSLLMTTVIIDFSNASTSFLANVECEYKIKGNTDRLQPAKCLKKGLNTDKLLTSNSPTTFFGRHGIKEALIKLADNVFSFLILIVAGGVFLLLGAMMVIRTVALWILMIVAPAAFVVGIMPFGSKYLKQWWGKLTSWAFYAVPVAFVFRIGVTILAAFQKPASESAGDNATTTEFAERVSPGNLPGVSFGTEEATAKSDFFQSMGYIFQYLVILVLLIAAYKIAQGAAESTGDFVTGKLANLGDEKAKQASNFVRRHTTGKAGRAATSGAAGMGANLLGKYEDSDLPGSGMAGRGKAALSEARGKRQAERTKGERKRLKNMSRKDLLDEAKSNNVEAQRLVAKRHWAKNKAEVPEVLAEKWHGNLSGYPDAQESLAEDRPDVGEEAKEDKEDKIKIKEFKLNSQNSDVTLSSGDKLGISWEVVAKDGEKDPDEVLHKVKINVSGNPGYVPGVESVEGNQGAKKSIDNLVEHSFPLDEDKTVNFQLLAHPQGGGAPKKETLSATFKATSGEGSKNSEIITP